MRKSDDPPIYDLVIWIGSEPKSRIRRALDILMLIALEAGWLGLPVIGAIISMKAAPVDASKDWAMTGAALAVFLLLNWILWSELTKNRSRARR